MKEYVSLLYTPSDYNQYYLLDISLPSQIRPALSLQETISDSLSFSDNTDNSLQIYHLLADSDFDFSSYYINYLHLISESLFDFDDFIPYTYGQVYFNSVYDDIFIPDYYCEGTKIIYFDIIDDFDFEHNIPPPILTITIYDNYFLYYSGIYYRNLYNRFLLDFVLFDLEELLFKVINSGYCLSECLLSDNYYFSISFLPLFADELSFYDSNDLNLTFINALVSEFLYDDIYYISRYVFLSDIIDVTDIHQILLLCSLYTNFNLSDIVSLDHNVPLLDYIYYYDNISSGLFNVLSDLLSILDYNKNTNAIYENIRSTFNFTDIYNILDVLKDVIKSYIYFDFAFANRFSFITMVSITKSHNLLLLKDGIYEFDKDAYVDGTSLCLDLSDVMTSRVKRIDKIFSNSNLSKCSIYADKVPYNLSGNGKWIDVPRGLRGNDFKVVLYDVDNIEFVEVDVFTEQRGKV